MIATIIQGGLGNQLFQYAMGRAVAIKRGGELLLDWRHYRLDSFRRYQLPLFNIRAREATGMDYALIRFARSERAKRVHSLAYAIAPWWKVPIVRDKQTGYDPSVFENRRHALFLGFWQTEQYFSSIRDLLLSELSFKQPASGENEDILKAIDDSNSVCLHVRRGDYIGNPDLPQLSTDNGMRYYREAIARIDDCVPDASFFIFSDDSQWTQANINAGPRTRFITHNVGTQDHEDLRLMMRCKHFIIANSTFSWWGAWLATNPGKMVIAPKVWNVANQAFSAHIVPSAWTRL